VKIAYFGLPLGAHLLLRDGHQLDPCVLSPLEAPGRRRVRQGVSADCLLDARELSKEELAHAAEELLQRSKPALIVSWFWTRLLPGAWLAAAPLGAIGVHPSLLPRHRGPNPYFWSIDSGDSEAGVTLHTLRPAYDTGAILLQRAILVGEQDSWRLARALDRPSLALLREGVARLARGEVLEPREQDESLATWAPEPTGRELTVDWRWSTERVLRRIRALSPVPGLAVEVAGFRFFVTRAHAASQFVAALAPGEAAVMPNAETLVIRTADGAIAVDRAVAAPEDDADDGDADLDARTLSATVAERLARASAGPDRSAP